MKYVLLTQDNCPDCEKLKLMLEKPLKGAYNGQIDVVHREESAVRFRQLSEQFGVMSTPALVRVSDGAVLKRFGIGEVRHFLSDE